MPEREEVCYFGAGPAPLPTPVLQAGSKAFLNHEQSGLSLAEISHRSSTATNILQETRAALTDLLKIPDTYEILFMHGGGSGEFSAVVYNLVAAWVERRRKVAEKELAGDEKAIIERVRKEVQEQLRLDYLVTGSWSLKASQEAANLLEPLGDSFVHVVTDARKSSGKFGSIPHEDTWDVKPTGRTECAFTYYCDNETVDGVEFPGLPKVLEADQSTDETPARIVVADMSSNFLSRQVDVSKYGVKFGGAQKNIGITDVTIVIVRKDLLAIPSPKFLHAVGVWSPPVVFSWPVIAKNNSLYNTMPIFSIWIAGQVMKGLLSRHGGSGLAGQEVESNDKAVRLYEVLDANPDVYQAVNDKTCRSRMNVCFRVKDEATETTFLAGAEKRMLLGLKGHRSVGGIRASNYNAVPPENVQRLVDYMREFAEQNR